MENTESIFTPADAGRLQHIIQPKHFSQQLPLSSWYFL
jgi:hypothetical protein